MKKPLWTLVMLVLAVFFFARPATAVVFGQIDDFESGLMGWNNGAGAVELISGGGPAGANDDYIRITAVGGNNSGGRLVARNFDQWLTDGFNNYITQGVTTIELDLINQGSVELSIRLAFKAQSGTNAPGFLSTAVVLAVGGGWQHFSIPITAANLIAINGPDPFDTFFSSGVGEMRIIHEVGAGSLNGDPVVAMLGIDNIRAVPEPTTMVLVSGSLIGFAVYLLRGKRRLGGS